MSKTAPKNKSSSAGGGDAAPESPSAASGSAFSASPLDAASRERAAALFNGVDPSHIWAYREYPDRHGIVVVDGVTATKMMVAK